MILGPDYKQHMKMWYSEMNAELHAANRSREYMHRAIAENKNNAIEMHREDRKSAMRSMKIFFEEVEVVLKEIPYEPWKPA